MTLAAQHAMSLGFSGLVRALVRDGERAHVALQQEEQAEEDLSTRSHHFFSRVPYHHRMGEAYGGARLGSRVERDVTEAVKRAV